MDPNGLLFAPPTNGDLQYCTCHNLPFTDAGHKHSVHFNAHLSYLLVTINVN